MSAVERFYRVCERHGLPVALTHVRFPGGGMRLAAKCGAGCSSDHWVVQDGKFGRPVRDDEGRLLRGWV